MDMEKLAAAMAPVIRNLVDRATAPLLDRIKELESRPLPEAIKGDQGPEGPPGKDGQDGISVSVEEVERMVHARMAQWELDFERRAQGILERAVDRMPKPKDGKDGRDGVDGKDGVGFDDLAVEHDGERGFTFRLIRGSEVREYGFTIPAVLDRGVYREGNDYLKGDAVSFGGSLWIAQRDLPPGKPGQCDGWRLAVKKGRDGRAA